LKPDLTTMAKIVAGALPGGAVGGRAEIIDMIAHRGDPEWDNRHRVYHPGTFNANPLSAVAGATCLELIASQPINQQADAMAGRLKRGLNDILGKMEVAGHAVTALKRGLQNRGVDIMGRDAFLVSATHTEEDVDQTLAGFESTLAAVRREGLV
jgi:glutamate-1-semialdehyde 2,1-aminomutase